MRWRCTGFPRGDPATHPPAAWDIRQTRRLHLADESHYRSGGCRLVLGPWRWGWTTGSGKVLSLPTSASLVPLPRCRVAEPQGHDRAAPWRQFLAGCGRHVVGPESAQGSGRRCRRIDRSGGAGPFSGHPRAGSSCPPPRGRMWPGWPIGSWSPPNASAG